MTNHAPEQDRPSAQPKDLGNLRNILPSSDESRRVAARRGRWSLRSSMRSFTHQDRLKACGVRPAGGGKGVSVTLRDGRGSMSGLQSCGSVWACPVCAAAVRQQRAQEIEQIVLEHVKRGGKVLFVTLTMSHFARHRLTDTFDAVASGWSEMWEGRFLGDFRTVYGLVGTIRSIEVTHGKNGWHPHAHVLLLLDPKEVEPQFTPKGKLKRTQLTGVEDLEVEDIAKLVENALWQRWQGVLTRRRRPAG